MVAALLATLLAASPASGVQARLDALAASGEPLFVHVVVALADNENQGLIPVPEALGNGQDPEHNLYWGARYGVGYYLTHDAGWTSLKVNGPLPDHVLRRLVLRKELERHGKHVKAYLVADAYDGAAMHDAIDDFLHFASGRQSVVVKVGDITLAAGGDAPVVAFVGHDGLMDMRVPGVDAIPDAPSRGAIVLACASAAYFKPMLKRAGAEPLLLTTGFMAPEAYTLAAELDATIAGETPATARESAATAYDKFQKCGLRGARRLFTGSD